MPMATLLSQTTSAPAGCCLCCTRKFRLEGRGIGSALIRGVLDIARSEGLKVNPLCPFAKAYIEKHPEYVDLRQ
jgi:predicted GNAT family acetyltransferase